MSIRTCLFLAGAVACGPVVGDVREPPSDPAIAAYSCASGGPATDGRVRAVTCTAPIDVSPHEASNGLTTWHSGPVARIR